jgi:hypothetical protein
MCSRDAVVADRDRAASAPRSGVHGAAKKTRCQSGSIDRAREKVFGGGGRSLILNFEAMESDGRGETKTEAMWVRLTREYDAMCVLFVSLVEWW